MPTVSNRDFSGHWSERKNIGEERLNSKRFEGGELNVLPNNFSNATSNIAEEHRYAVTQRFISSNSYYGYHPVISSGNAEDCSMDTSEVAAATGLSPDRTFSSGWFISRKRCLDSASESDNGIAVRKRARCDSFRESVDPCNPLPTSCPVAAVPQQQLPGNTSYLMESVMPRPRCLMGHYV